jgi:DNA repair photolyase
MKINEITAKSILRKHKKIDSWFISRYGMNLYRGCTHNCVYCDGRSERYYVDGEFGKDIAVKINAIEILRKELSSGRRSAAHKNGFLMVGGGVGDSYQSVEKKYQLTRKTLYLLHDLKQPVHLLTKSTLIERDMEIIQKINQKSRAMVSMSFSSMDDKMSSFFEPGVPSPQARMELLGRFKKKGIPCGVFLLPVIPFISDTREMMGKIVSKAKQLGLDFVIFGGMTLKTGRQREYFVQRLKRYKPELVDKYSDIYRQGKWGEATPEYYRSIYQTFDDIVKKHKIPQRIPYFLFKDLLDENDLAVVTLEHLNYYWQLQGKESPFGYAAYAISQLKEPLSHIKKSLKQLKGIGKFTESLILELLQTGQCSYYEEFLLGRANRKSSVDEIKDF